MDGAETYAQLLAARDTATTTVGGFVTVKRPDCDEFIEVVCEDTDEYLRKVAMAAGRMVPCTAAEYHAALAVHGGLCTPASKIGLYASYTRVDGDAFGTGYHVLTVWGLEGTDQRVCESRGVGPTGEAAVWTYGIFRRCA